VVGPVERHEALRVKSCLVDPRRVLDPDHLVAWRMQDQQWPVQIVDPRLKVLLADIVQELTADREAPAGELDGRLSRPFDGIEIRVKVLKNVLGICRRADRHDSPDLRHVASCRQHGCAPERVTDKELGRAVMLGQVRGCAPQILDVRGEVRSGEFPAGLAEPGKVEPQHADPSHGEFGRDPVHREGVLRAGEAMREERVGPHRTWWKVEPCGQLIAAAAWKRDAPGRGHMDVLEFVR
jgi:hypothetical protein